LIRRGFSYYIKKRQENFTYEGYAKKLQDKGLDFPHGKRNKIILAARELDQLIVNKLLEVEKQAIISKEIEEIKGQGGKLDKEQEEKMEGLKSKREIVCGNGCVSLYRAML
jgi:hypothetical protein